MLKFRVIIGFLTVFVLVASVSAEEKKKEPKLGNIAAAGSSNVDKGIGYVGDDMRGDSDGANPITGSMSKKANSCIARVFNNSDDRYSATILAKGLDKNGGVTTTRSFSLSLGAKQSAERQMAVGNNTSSCSLDLTSVRNLSPQTDQKVKAPAASSGAANDSGAVPNPADGADLQG